MSTDRASGGLTGAFVFAAIAIVLVIVGVAVTAWLGGRANASGRTATVVRTAGAGGTQTTASNVSPIVAAGAHDYNQFACAQCHGIGGVGGVSADVPALNRLGTAFTVAQLRQIIEHGLGESANPTKPYMPVWHGIVSPRQVSELAAYIRAGLPPVSGATPVAVPTDQGPAVEGSALYVRDGCVNCHGPNGLGGVPAVAGQDDPAALRRRFPERHRPGADRQHAALGRDPARGRRAGADRLPGDAPVARGLEKRSAKSSSLARCQNTIPR